MPSKTTELLGVYRPHPRIYQPDTGPSRAKQSFAEESEINNIMAKYEKTGLISHAAKHAGAYVDLPAHDEFVDAMNQVATANSMFEELPSGMRSRFRNDPAQFLDFVGNPDNEEAMIEMGLLKAPGPFDEARKQPKPDEEPSSTEKPPTEAPAPDEGAPAQ